MPATIDTVPLFPALAAELLGFLRDLQPADWERATVLPTWRVRDIAAHLLDTALRRLSGGRDGYRPHAPGPAITGPADLARYVTSVADGWVAALHAVSPAVLTDLLAHVEPQLHAYFASLDPVARARIGVPWAGEARSAVWFDVAREYTERWHHQMQIREAFGDRAIQSRELYAPVIATFMRALPFHYRGVPAVEGAAVMVEISGAAGGRWYIARSGDGWFPAAPRPAAASARIAQEAAWKIFTHFGAGTVAPSDVSLDGDPVLARHILSMTCIIV
jgi:uncharacterized protein (TIGR03083 family)